MNIAGTYRVDHVFMSIILLCLCAAILLNVYCKNAVDL
jgi:hypothetical protein